MSLLRATASLLFAPAFLALTPVHAQSQSGVPLTECAHEDKIVRVTIHASKSQKGWTANHQEKWIEQQFEAANRLFKPLRICFFGRVLSPLSDRDNRIRTRAQRTRVGRLKSHQHPGDITLFIVDRLDDIDLIGQEIRGVHWRDPKNRRDKRWIILSRIAKSMVLAHELGHYFSLPHSDDPISLMNKRKRAKPPFGQRRFSETEIKRMSRFAKTCFRRGLLKDHSKMKNSAHS